jgi:hypothetical protein
VRHGLMLDPEIVKFAPPKVRRRAELEALLERIAAAAAKAEARYEAMARRAAAKVEARLGKASGVRFSALVR